MAEVIGKSERLMPRKRKDFTEAIEASKPAPELPRPIVSLLDALPEVEMRLAAFGREPVTPWWRDVLERFYAQSLRQLVLRVGRRGRKSETLCLVGVLEARWGNHPVPNGDVGVVAVVSVDLREAGERLRVIDSLLTWLDIPHKTTARAIKLETIEGRPDIEFRTYAATMGGVRGFTCICAILDEVAFWKDVDTGANPATEVIESLRPAMVAMPNARMFLSSSPLGMLDAHADAFNAGDGGGQMVAFAPTWVANPSVTEEATRFLCVNEQRWSREYGAIPMEGTEESLLSSAMLDRCTRTGNVIPPREPGLIYVAAMDPGFVRNPWTLAVACMRWDGEKIKRSIVGVWEWKGTSAKPNEPETVLRDVAAIVKPYGIEMVESDQYERFGLDTIARRKDIGLYIRVESRGSQERLGMYEAIVTKFSDGEIDIPEHAQLRADLLGIRQKLTAGGFTISLQEVGDRHCDYAPSVVLALSSKYHREPAVKPPIRLLTHADVVAKIQSDMFAKHRRMVEHDAD